MRNTTVESTTEPAGVAVSELLQVRIADGSDGLTYCSRVQDVAEGRLVIAWPTHNGVRLLARRDQVLDFFVMRNELPLEFKGAVQEVNLSPLPLIAVVPKSPITKVQRRQDFRIKCLIPVELAGSVRDPRDGSATALAFRTVTSDLSASGLMIRHPKVIAEDSVLEIKLELPDGGPPLRIPCRVVYSESRPENPSMYRTGMTYLAITEWERARIVRFAYRTQLKGIHP